MDRKKFQLHLFHQSASSLLGAHLGINLCDDN